MQSMRQRKQFPDRSTSLLVFPSRIFSPRVVAERHHHLGQFALPLETLVCKGFPCFGYLLKGRHVPSRLQRQSTVNDPEAARSSARPKGHSQPIARGTSTFVGLFSWERGGRTQQGSESCSGRHKSASRHCGDSISRQSPPLSGPGASATMPCHRH